MEDSTTNSYLIDPENAAEMARLINLDHFTTRAMGGPLAGLPELPRGASVLDLACGPGGWVLDVAYERPDLDVAGVDISNTMISYANARARSEGRSNASFGVMDITQTLDFTESSFALINGRLLVGFLSREGWPQLVQAVFRLVQPGGVFRLTETESAGSTNSPAFEQLAEFLGLAFTKAGYGFGLPERPRSPTITHRLSTFLRNAGFTQISGRAHLIDFSAGTPAWAEFYQNSLVLFRVTQPLLVNTGVVSLQEIERLYQQMQIEMCSDEFCGIWTYVSFWGIKP